MENNGIFEGEFSVDILFKTIFGAHLYGTDTPNSDKDYKAVYAPSMEDLILNRVKLDSSIHESNKTDNHAKSDSSVYEIEYYTLHKFLKQATDGQLVAIEMLYSPPQFWIGQISDFFIREIICKREKFLSKNLIKFVQYAVKQAAKYGIKGSRLHTATKFLKFFENIDEKIRLNDIIIDIEPLLDDHSEIYYIDNNPAESMLIICGKKFSFSTKVRYIRNALRKFVDKYGARAKLAVIDKGIDKKACSHAFRAAFEVKELVLTRNLVFPLKEREFLRDIKTGKYTYSEFAPMLEDLIDEVSHLVIKSDLPDTPQVDIDEIIKKYYAMKSTIF
jgi:hypothetical protein